MSAWMCALWGLFGAAAVEGLDIRAAISNTRRFPWTNRRNTRTGQIPVPAYVVSAVIRLALGAGLAYAAGTSPNQTIWTSIMIGVAAPVIVERVARAVPHTNPAGPPVGQVDAGREPAGERGA